MSITFNCPHCQRPLKVKDELAGKKVKCPGCGKPVAVPQAAATLASGVKPPTASRAEDRTLPPVYKGRAGPESLTPCTRAKWPGTRSRRRVPE